MTERPKVPDSKSGVPVRVPGVRIPFSPPAKQADPSNLTAANDEAESSPFAPRLHPLSEADLESAIAGVTRALGAVDDPELAAELVAERRVMREELRELREAAAGVVRLRPRP
jgi:hypothetical protein